MKRNRHLTPKNIMVLSATVDILSNKQRQKQKCRRYTLDKSNVSILAWKCTKYIFHNKICMFSLIVEGETNEVILEGKFDLPMFSK